MSPEKPNAGKPVQQLLRVLLLCKILNTNKSSSGGLPNREIPTNEPPSLETENMVDPAEKISLIQRGCVTMSDLLNTSPFLAQ